jgi:hypothetical protein
VPAFHTSAVWVNNVIVSGYVRSTLQQMTEPAAQSTPSGDAAGSTSSGDSTAGESQQGSPDREADVTAVAQGMHRVTVSDLTTMSTTGSALGDEAPLSEGPSDKP